ncbi:MAG: hypothetical protein AAF514_05105 [Verrucomicrobiota bacterium]
MNHLLIGAWIVGILVSFFYRQRTLPVWVLLGGIAVLALQATLGLGTFAIGIMAVLTVVIWFSNVHQMI